MVVSRGDFAGVLAKIKALDVLALDTETFGLRPYHGDRLFSLILAGGEPLETWYLNFNPATDVPIENVLLPSHLAALRDGVFSDPTKTWAGHNLKFDLAMLLQEGIEIAGEIHCTKALARIERNDHHSYSLDACGERIGVRKDEAVEKYIADHKLWEHVVIPGKKARDRKMYFDRVPFPIIVPYAERDADLAYHLFRHQEAACQALDDEVGAPPRKLMNVFRNERRLTNTVFRMESRGLLIDKKYCERAAAYEADRAKKASSAFKQETGHAFMASPKLFAQVFESEKERWVYTDKGNPSFEGDVLKTFQSPAARHILNYRDSKSKADFYYGFLHHADRDGVVHPNLNPDGTDTGRFSSSSPNFQNLTAEDAFECVACWKGYETIPTACKKCQGTRFREVEYLVRKAIIPRPGFVFIMPDFDQMEYRMMLDLAAQLAGRMTPLIQKVLGGLDVHQATANAVLEASGLDIGRDKAKNGNFATLYGSGLETLAATLGATVAEARAVREGIFQAAPEIKLFIRTVMRTAERRGYICNWAGRRSYFPDTRFTYKAPNYLIQGGTADVNKFALNAIDEYLLDKKSKLVLTVHDENPVEVHESEIATVPQRVKEIMESIYPSKYLPLTAGMEFSAKSLGEKTKGFPF